MRSRKTSQGYIENQTFFFFLKEEQEGNRQAGRQVGPRAEIVEM